MATCHPLARGSCFFEAFPPTACLWGLVQVRLTKAASSRTSPAVGRPDEQARGERNPLVQAPKRTWNVFVDGRGEMIGRRPWKDAGGSPPEDVSLREKQARRRPREQTVRRCSAAPRLRKFPVSRALCRSLLFSIGRRIPVSQDRHQLSWLAGPKRCFGLRNQRDSIAPPASGRNSPESLENPSRRFCHMSPFQAPLQLPRFS